MLKRPGGEAVPTRSRARDTLTIMTKEVQIPDDPDDTDATDDSDVPVVSDDSVSEEDLPVPNTSGTTPETGANTKQDGSNIGVLIYVLPMVVMVLAGGLSMRRKNKAHRKFD